ncbi:uncharacterized protein LOC122501102 isoform X2 [Leptopilina heterotoma]|uniref:uncharacterized protein LOC122501100 isoform X2 n=1 Tax=Leptopilina heterotoma TaxID=63436 RepID=UPI001CA983F5|nr:uncharacterized protein LOC122501100 isoform X2 [Leptopilina heterotoma]XP_043466308.1 uncharacterized protein LOC122501102 isoform X2 [Leptopilina heterotoma]
MLTLTLDTIYKFTDSNNCSRNLVEGVLLLQVENNLDKVTIEKMHCSCKAGASQKCKHIVAVLIFCSRLDILKLEKISSTERKCLWKKHKVPVLEQFEAQPTKMFCHVNQDRLPRLSDNDLNEIRKELIHCDRETAVAKHFFRKRNEREDRRIPLQNIENCQIPLRSIENTYESSSPPSENQYINLIIDNSLLSEDISSLSNVVFKMKNCCQNVYNSKIVCNDVFQKEINTKRSIIEWKIERKYRITGSRCYNIYTYSKNDWENKSVKYFWPTEFKTKETNHGIKFEAEAREAYKKQCNLHVEECGLIICQSEPWLAYSPDGVVFNDSKLYRLLEIKCPFELENTERKTLLKKCKYLKKNEVTLKEKHQYYGQVQLGMTLLNLKQCDFVIYSSKSKTIEIITVDYDKEFTTKLLNTLKKNYFENMLHYICLNSRVL